jgi:glycosyltransferase involved in cell wall biosynthesis
MENKKMTFIVSTFPAFSSSILESQLFPKAKLLSKLGWFCQFIGADVPERCTAKNLEDLRCRYGFGDIKVFPLYPSQPTYFSLVSMIKSLNYELKYLLRDWKPVWVYFRNIFEFCALNTTVHNLGIQCVYDSRGAIADEVRHKNPGIVGVFKELIAFRKEKIVFQKADHLLCVSARMSDWIKEKYGRIDTSIIPCCADQNQFRPDKNARLVLRAELCWSDDSPVVVYAGGVDYWQRPKDIATLLGKVKSFVPELKVLILSSFEKEFASYFKLVNFPLEDVYIRKVSHIEVSKWLNVADLGIILRHDILLNNVASPIKIGEYLSTGLGVICTRGIGDYSYLISKFGAGLELDDNLSVESLMSLIKDPNQLGKCSQNARQLSKLFSREFELLAFSEFLDKSGLNAFDELKF